MNDSLMVVAERCRVKTKQVEEQEEAMSDLNDKNLVSVQESAGRKPGESACSINPVTNRELWSFNRLPGSGRFV